VNGVNGVWLLGGLALAGVAAALLMSRPRDAGPDLGSVSGQWLVEHRQSKES
jgi:hypothetical protein